MKNKVISLQQLSKSFSRNGLETQALKAVCLDIFEGDYVSISGPSGSGKSTLLSILGLLEKPTGGTYKLADVDVLSLDYDQLADLRNQHIGFVFQAFNLIDELTVSDNVALPLQFRQPKMSKAEIQQKVMDILAKLNLAERAEHKPGELSGGQQQRVAIARALVGEPSILLVDEPTGNLDRANGERVMELLDSLNEQGVTILMVTHEPQYANRAKSYYQILDGELSISTVADMAEAV